jgi:hypothetical protein
VAENLITRVADDDNYLQTVARAMTTADPRTVGSEYFRMDYSEVLTVANTEHTPLSNRLSRREACRDITHYWLEQYIPGAGVVTPIAETSDPAENNRFLPTRYSNNIMKIGRKFIISDLMNIIAQAGGLHAVGTDEWGRQMQMQLTMLLRDQEAAILKAVLGTSPLSMRGILGDYVNGNENGWIGLTAEGGIVQDGVKNLAGDELVSGTPGASQQNIEKVLNDYMLQMFNLNAGPMPTSVYVAPRAFWMLQQAAKSKITVFMTQAELAKRSEMNLGGAVGKYYTDFGNMIDVIAHPLLSAAVPADLAAEKEKSRFLFLYEPGLSLIDILNYGGIHIEPRAKTDPTETRVISEIFSMEVRYLKSHGVIKNFSIAA